MNAASDNLQTDEELEGMPEVDTFSSSLAPVNRTEKLLFSLKDRICCISVLATFFALIRLLLSK